MDFNSNIIIKYFHIIRLQKTVWKCFMTNPMFCMHHFTLQNVYNLQSLSVFLKILFKVWKHSPNTLRWNCVRDTVHVLVSVRCSILSISNTNMNKYMHKFDFDRCFREPIHFVYKQNFVLDEVCFWIQNFDDNGPKLDSIGLEKSTCQRNR